MNWSRLFAVKRFCKSFCRGNGLQNRFTESADNLRFPNFL